MRLDLLPNGFDNTSCIGQNLRVGKAENAEAEFGENRVALLIVFRVSEMHAAIGFDNQPCRITLEVHNKTTYDLLSPELDAQRRIAEAAP